MTPLLCPDCLRIPLMCDCRVIAPPPAPRGRVRCTITAAVSGPCSQCGAPMDERAHLGDGGPRCERCCPLCARGGRQVLAAQQGGPSGHRVNLKVGMPDEKF